MKQKSRLSTKKIPKDPENREEVVNRNSSRNSNQGLTKLLGAFFVILSGFILYLDKIFVLLGITLENNHGWNNTEAYIWNLSQTIAPFLIIIGMYLRAYFVSAIVPVFCYTLQLYFVINSCLTIDRPLTWVYVTGTSLLFMVVMYTIKRMSRLYIERKIKEAKAEIEKYM